MSRWTLVPVPTATLVTLSVLKTSDLKAQERATWWDRRGSENSSAR